MVEAIVKELETLKAKVEETIAHVKSGVNTLNEDQIAKTREMVYDLGDAFDDMHSNVMKELKVPGTVSGPVPSVLTPPPMSTGTFTVPASTIVAATLTVPTTAVFAPVAAVEGVGEAIKTEAEKVLTEVEHAPAVVAEHVETIAEKIEHMFDEAKHKAE